MKNNIINSKQLIQDIVKNIQKQSVEKPVQISQKTQNIVFKLSTLDSEGIGTFLKEKAHEIGLRDKNLKLYAHENVLLLLSDGNTSYNLEQTLKSKSGNVMPKFVSYIELGKDRFLSILEGDTEALVPYREVAESITDKQKQLFKTDFKEHMLKTGLINKETFANKEPLFVRKSDNSIIYADWGNLQPVEKDLREYYSNLINNLI